VFKELRPESLLDDDDPDDDHATVVLHHAMTKDQDMPRAGDERAASRRVSSFGTPKGTGGPGPEDGSSLYERLMRAGALDDSLGEEAGVDAHVPLTPPPEAPTPSSPWLSVDMGELADELEPARDSAEPLRESDLDILDDGAFISVRPESSPISYPDEPRPIASLSGTSGDTFNRNQGGLPSGRVPGALPSGRMPSVLLGPGASTRAEPTSRLASIPSTHPLANTLLPVANSIPPRRSEPERGTPWWQVALAAVALIALGASLGRLQQRMATQETAQPAAQPSAETVAREDGRLIQPSTSLPLREPEGAELPPGPPRRESRRAKAKPEVAVTARTTSTAAPASSRELTATRSDAVARSEDAVVRPEHTAIPSNEAAERARAAESGATVKGSEPVDSALPAQPSREAVVAALSSISAQLSACVGQKHGTANVNLTVRGTGVVSHALVTGTFAGTPEGSCIARAVKLARFEPFRDAFVRITYPFQL
jgi:hypothetical protein